MDQVTKKTKEDKTKRGMDTFRYTVFTKWW